MKSEIASVAERYAEAVMDLAETSGGKTDETILNDITAVNKVIKETPELETILRHPSIPADEKKTMLVSMFSKHVNDLTMRLLEMLIDKRRFEILPAIEVEYKSLFFARKNMASGILTSAEPLSDSVVAEIRQKISKRLGKHLELEVKVDQSLIGGAILRVGDQVIDGSLSGKLKALEKVLVSV